MNTAQRPVNQSLCESIVAHMPARILVVDQDMTIRYANPTYCKMRGVSLDEIMGTSLEDLFPAALLSEAGLAEAISNTITHQHGTHWSGYRQPTPDHGERVIDIRLDPCLYEGEELVLLTIQDVSERHRQLYERDIIQQISRVMLSIVNLPRLLHAILTAMTAGGAAGLGFNRAILLLVDEEAGLLKGEMAVGPRDAEQAYEIWSQVELQDHSTLDDLLLDESQLSAPEEQPLHDLVEQLQFPLADTDTLPTTAVAEAETCHVTEGRNDLSVDQRLYDLLQTDDFVVAPLLIEGQAIGAVIADNFVTRVPISEADVQLLNTLANHAALAIDRARAYEKLQQRAGQLEEAYEQLADAQKEKIEAEKLAAVGELTAMVAHEIRNPLATIGGFARSMLRGPEELDRILRNSQIILDEVERLEQILRRLLDFARAPSSGLVLDRIEPLVEYARQVTESLAEQADVEIRVSVEQDLPEVFLDHDQFQQVMINLVRNAVEAMPDGGVLEIGARRAEESVELYVSDTGAGISEEHVDEIFDLFYTTKPSGTGLGLALSQRIVERHGAELRVSSEKGKGTTFVIAVPIPTQGNEAAQA